MVVAVLHSHHTNTLTGGSDVSSTIELPGNSVCKRQSSISTHASAGTAHTHKYTLYTRNAGNGKIEAPDVLEGSNSVTGIIIKYSGVQHRIYIYIYMSVYVAYRSLHLDAGQKSTSWKALVSP